MKDKKIKIDLISDFSNNKWDNFDLMVGIGPTPMDKLEEGVLYLFNNLSKK